MTARIDEDTAWSLLRAVPRVLTDDTLPRRVPHDRLPDVWVQVKSADQWQTSRPTTQAAQDLLDLFLPLQMRPDLTIGQIGQSLDGRIATRTGQSHYITGPADITRLHRLRALVDAVVVGGRTVAADDPQLTVRRVEGANPVRVVLDPGGRLPAEARVFRDGAATTLYVTTAGRPDAESFAGERVESATLPADDDQRFDPANVLRLLRDRGLRRVLVEGGGITVSRFLEARTLDRLHVAVAPIIVGSGHPAFTLTPIDSLDQALRPPCRRFSLGSDVLFDFDLHMMKGT